MSIHSLRLGLFCILSYTGAEARIEPPTRRSVHKPHCSANYPNLLPLIGFALAFPKNDKHFRGPHKVKILVSIHSLRLGLFCILSYTGAEARIEPPTRRSVHKPHCSANYPNLLPLIGFALAFPKNDKHFRGPHKVKILVSARSLRLGYFCILSYTGALRWNRTTDTRIFSPLLYRLSYEAKWRFRRDLNPRSSA